MMTSPHEGLKRKGWDISGEDLCTWKREITLYLRDALVLCSMKDNSSNKNEITAIIPSILYANRCDYWHDNYQWQYKQYSVKKLNFYYVNLQIGESLVTAVEIWIFRKIIKTPDMEQKMFIKSKLLAWSAKSRKTPGMECKVQINSWHGAQSSFK
jgi:hypothetical protein